MKTYQITLLDNKTFAYMKSYESDIIPIKGDYLSIEDDKVFIVKNRLLATTNSNITFSTRILLFGDVTTLKFSF